jgi:lysophospholipase L1-like esterase
MRRFGFVVAVATSVATLGVALAGSVGATSPPALRYVALGDSYSAGVGAGSYLAASGACERSTKAYSQLWADAHAPASYVSVACSGATTSDVTGSQLSALGGAITLVSITVGGNDIGFAHVMRDCVLHSTSTCVREVTGAEQEARSVLPSRLAALYTAIRAAAPHAEVVVLDYPRLYDLHTLFCVGLSSTDRSKINEGADVLDGVIAAAVGRRPGFAFADVRSAFGHGHEICDGSSWLHSIDWTDLNSSYHPTASGQSGGYLPAFTAMATG